MQTAFPSETLQALLEVHTDDVAGLVLRLAWRAGLTRTEIQNLQWSQCTPTHIHLSDRSIPLEPEVSTFLSHWRNHFKHLDMPYVAISSRSGHPLSGAALSQACTRALASSGIEHLTLIDLRRDYVHRQLETKDWQEAIQITGLPVSSYFRSQAPVDAEALKTSRDRRRAENPSDIHIPLDPDTEQTLLSVMEEERDTVAGLAMAMAYYTTVGIIELVSLTWDQIQNGKLCLPAREIPLPAHIQKQLREIQSQRLSTDDPHVFLTERSHKPMDASWLLVMVRTPLVRAGLGNVTLRTIRAHAMYKSSRNTILEAVLHHGLTVKETAKLLSTSTFIAAKQLHVMVEDGTLVQVAKKYYHPQHVPFEISLQEQIQYYIEANGPSAVDDLAEHYQISMRKVYNVLRDMRDKGDAYYDRETRLYSLIYKGPVLSPEKPQEKEALSPAYIQIEIPLI